MKKVKRIVLALVAAGTLLGCKNQIGNVENNDISNAPYATESELIDLKNKGYVNYGHLEKLQFFELPL